MQKMQMHIVQCNSLSHSQSQSVVFVYNGYYINIITTPKMVRICKEMKDFLHNIWLIKKFDLSLQRISPERV